MESSIRGTDKLAKWHSFGQLGAVWPVGLACVLAVGLALAASRESLWLDELHTSWVVSTASSSSLEGAQPPQANGPVEGGLSRLNQAAREGNQTPVYFWLIAAVTWTLGHSESTLRFPSMLAWVAAVALAVWQFVHFPVSGAGAGPAAGCQRSERMSGPRPHWWVAPIKRCWVSVGGTYRLAARFLWLAPIGWLLLDRIQWFYATEARVYALVQLLSLIAWLLVFFIAKDVADRAAQVGSAKDWEVRPKARGFLASIGSVAARHWRLCAWSGTASLLLALHPTAVLPVVCQAGWLIFSRALQGCRFRRWGASDARDLQPAGWVSLGAALLVVGMVGGVIAAMQAPVWERREQWESFAGDASLDSLLTLFPLLPLAIPVLVARAVDAGVQLRSRSGTEITDSRRTRKSVLRGWQLRGHCRTKTATPREVWHSVQRGVRKIVAQTLGGACPGWFWLLAAAGPWLAAWLITWCDVAPVLHRRFVIAAAVPWWLAVAYQWTRIRATWVRTIAAVVVLAWLVVGQGTVAAWSRGEWLGWQRTEDWRGLSTWLQRQVQPGDELWCASGLIEGSGLELPLTPQQDTYLSFPLRGIYRVDPDGVPPPSVHASVNEPSRWGKQWELHEAGRNDPEAAGQRRWIVFRGSAARLESRLQQLLRGRAGGADGEQSLDGVSGSASDSLEPTMLQAPRGFGSLSVALVRW